MDDDDSVQYRVVLNDEEQYSIWPVDRECPAGWRDEGTVGTKDECIRHIDEVWTDMRPLSLRRYLEQAEHDQAGSAADALADLDDDEESLVARLSGGDHPVEVSLRPEPTALALREAIQRGYVFVRFTGTRGGTELGLSLDAEATDISRADFDQARGPVVLVGDLTLDFEPVRCTAEIDLGTMAGRGHLSARAAAE